MKYLKYMYVLALFVFVNYTFGQRIVVKPTPDSWTTSNSLATYKDKIIHLKKTTEKSAVLWLNDMNFENGTIELDIKGKDERGNSFVGLAFHGSDDTNFDVVYFRPFNFKNPEKKDHSIQYINAPNEPWHVLRKQFPKKYENSVFPVPDPNNWFHAKIVIKYPQIKVYVNDSKTPSLEVDQRSERTDGKLGLWIDSEEGWFKNVVIQRG
ncbi:family 16 glycoside hydrolase [Flavivirga eckloniae]|uniref:3-keto-alpha-glucoside-1,2-lyase/3-keto-2-hydroxy-glucal hydratase domain-containing protein n=1 Tax=Flavivirga eckloniae TaxID=1803846 RepID=A0A2K9PK26_9FLAO|nr:family 16 glycoside hydrolase [Flavivirga eckloniae]AUP77400.1 hypothetical protein C1H87_01150 [Flavivirga eckloniae]